MQTYINLNDRQRAIMKLAIGVLKKTTPITILSNEEMDAFEEAIEEVERKIETAEQTQHPIIDGSADILNS